MRIKCPECHVKFSEELNVCPNCGYVVYESIFTDIAQEVESDMQKVTDYELKRVARESSKKTGGAFSDKLTLEEFEALMLKEGRIEKNYPILPKSYFRQKYVYEAELKAMYNAYLKTIGYK